MNSKSLKGLAIDKETIIVFVVIFVVFATVMAFLLNVESGTADIYSDMDCRAECAKWMTTEPPCSGNVEEYPALNATFKKDTAKAKESCGCP